MIGCLVNNGHIIILAKTQATFLHSKKKQNALYL